jgi:hypothetical protein
MSCRACRVQEVMKCLRLYEPIFLLDIGVNDLLLELSPETDDIDESGSEGERQDSLGKAGMRITQYGKYLRHVGDMTF